MGPAYLTLCLALAGQQAHDAGVGPARTGWLTKLDNGQSHLWTLHLIDR